MRSARAESPEIGQSAARCKVGVNRGTQGTVAEIVLEIHVCTDFDAGRGNVIDIVRRIDLVNR